MNRTLVRTDNVAIKGGAYVVRYFELRTPRGGRRYSAEILLADADHIILDDDSMMNLETRVARLIPATVYSRTLSRTA